MKEPSFDANALLRARRWGVLSTHSERIAGYPFASVVPYALDSGENPVFLLSRLAQHTKNIFADKRVSFLVYEASAETDPLTAARLTLFGDVEETAEEEARAAYLALHPESLQWVGFGDFKLYRMVVRDAYYIGGFGVMGWLRPGRL